MHRITRIALLHAAALFAVSGLSYAEETLSESGPTYGDSDLKKEPSITDKKADAKKESDSKKKDTPKEPSDPKSDKKKDDTTSDKKKVDTKKESGAFSNTIAKTAPHGFETIESALESAYLNNTELAAAISRVNQADESISQAKAGYRPRIDGTVSVGSTRVDNKGLNVQTGSSASRTTSSPTASAGIQVKQNIYAGGSTIASVKGAENTVLSTRASLMSSEQSIFYQVIQAFLEIITGQAEIEQYQGNVKALTETLAATKDRFNVGEETRTSVAQAEAQLAEGIAQLKDAEASLEAKHATFQRLTGRRAKTVQKPSMSKDLPGTLEQAIQIGLENNPDVIQAKYDEAAAKYEVDRIGGGLLPSIDLSASTTKSSSKDSVTYVNGFSASSNDKNTNVSASVTMTVPIYEQGLTRSQKRGAHEKAAERRIGVETTRRKVTENIITLWANYLSAKANIEQFKTQIEARKISLEGTRQEMMVGTKILLDVLNAQRDLLAAQLNFIRAEKSFYLAFYQLLGGMGRLTAKQMKLKVNYYDPSIHYKDTKDRV